MARAHLLASMATITLVTSLVAGVLILVGESVASEARVLGQIDAAGTRMIVVRARGDDPVPAGLVDVLSRTSEVERVTGLGPIRDTYPLGTHTGTPIAVRALFGAPVGQELPLPDHPPSTLWGWATEAATAQAGFRDGVGTLVLGDGTFVEVMGHVQLPEHYRFLEPVVLVPQDLHSGPAAEQVPLTVVIVMANRPANVRGVEALTRSMLTESHSDATVETSSALAELRGAVSGELAGYRHTVVLVALGLGAALVALSVFTATTRQRRDFGRRRALGARRSLVAALVLAQVGLCAFAGTITGTIAGLTYHAALGRPPIPISFVLALALAAFAVPLLAATLPAAIAARREPLTELRVP